MSAQNFSLTITSGQNTSAVVPALDNAPAVSIWIGAPSGLAETVKLQTRRPIGPTPQPWYDQQSNGADVVCNAGKAVQVICLSGIEWRLLASVNVGADRVFDIVVCRIIPQVGNP
jgi:hypothetical protein